MPGIFDEENRAEVDSCGVRGVWTAGAELDDRARNAGDVGQKRLVEGRFVVWA